MGTGLRLRTWHGPYAELKIDLRRFFQLRDVDEFVSSMPVEWIPAQTRWRALRRRRSGRRVYRKELRPQHAVRRLPVTHARTAFARVALSASVNAAHSIHGGSNSNSKFRRAARNSRMSGITRARFSPGVTRRSTSMTHSSGTMLTLVPPLILPTLSVALPHSGCALTVNARFSEYSCRAETREAAGDGVTLLNTCVSPLFPPSTTTRCAARRESDREGAAHGLPQGTCGAGRVRRRSKHSNRSSPKRSTVRSKRSARTETWVWARSRAAACRGVRLNGEPADRRHARRARQGTRAQTNRAHARPAGDDDRVIDRCLCY